MNSKWKSQESGGAMVATICIVAAIFSLSGLMVYVSALKNQQSARMANLRSETTGRDVDITRRLIREIPSAIFTSMQSNSSAATARGDLNISSTVSTVAADYSNVSGRISLAGISMTNKINADWMNGTSLSASGVRVGASFDLVSNLLTRWGSGPSGDAGSPDLWLYPSSLIGLVTPGTSFIGRRYQWDVTTTFTDTRDIDAQAANRTYTRTHTTVRRFSLYEVPFQTSMLADGALTVGTENTGAASGAALSVQGGVYGRNVTLGGSVAVAGSAASAAGVTIGAGSRVAGSTITIPTTRGTEIYAVGGLLAARQVSEGNNSLEAAFITIAPGQAYYCSVASPLNWDLYVRPFYRCAVRIQITNNTLPSMAVTITTFDLGTVAGMTTTWGGRSWTFNSANWATQSFLQKGTTTSGVDDRTLLTINAKAMAQYLSLETGRPATAFNTVYVGETPTVLPSPATAGQIAVSLSNTKRMSDVFTTGFSLVTRQRFYHTSSFNEEFPVPCSVIAPEIFYGTTPGTSRRVQLAGQLGVISGGVASNPGNLQRGDGGYVTTALKSVTATQTTNPASLPPITPVNWLVTCELR